MARPKPTALPLEENPPDLSEPERLPDLTEQPLGQRLAYVRDLVRGLDRLIGDQELRLLRYFLAMAAEEAHTQAELALNRGGSALTAGAD